MIKRVFYLPGMKRLDANLFKVTVERPSRFNLYAVPEDIWNRYWYEMRLPLTREAISTLKGVTDIDVDGYIPILDACEIAMKMGVKYSPTSMSQDASKGVLRFKKIKEVKYINQEDLDRVLNIKTFKKP